MKKHLVLLVIAGMGLASSSRAADGVAVELGQGNGTDMGRVSLIRQWDRKWFTGGSWYLTGYWDASLGLWHSASPGGKDIWDIGLTPVFRLRSSANEGLRPYAEAAVGAHFISSTHVNDGIDMGSSFQFGDHLGVGLFFGDKGQFDLGYRFQHLSNCEIKAPNDGINFQQIRLAYRF